MESRNLKNILSFVAALLIPQLVGGLGATATNSGMPIWYRRLRKPAWNPPAPVFPIAWTALYLLMGAASWLVWRQGADNRYRGREARSALGLYGIHLVFNLLWSVIFFGQRQIGLALGEIGILWGLILATLLRFYRLSPLAGLLLVPYQLWTTFAAALNASIWWMNRK